jgi:hypothetical protein
MRSFEQMRLRSTDLDRRPEQAARSSGSNNCVFRCRNCAPLVPAYDYAFGVGNFGHDAILEQMKLQSIGLAANQER